MKNSEMFKYAQCAVIECKNMTNTSKLELLRFLMAKEDFELFLEEHTEKEKAE